MKKVKMTDLQSVLLGCLVFLFGTGFGSSTQAIDLNDFTLDVQVIVMETIHKELFRCLRW